MSNTQHSGVPRAPAPGVRRKVHRYLLLALLSTACGGGDPSGPSGGSASLSATIDGQAWTSEAQYLQAGLTQQSPGHFPVYGARGTSASSITGITLNLTSIPGPGTYPLGTTSNVAGGMASVNVGSSVWSTPLSGEAGTVTITSIGNGRVAGSFAFVAEAVSGGTGTKTVTNGQFNVPLTSTGGLQIYDAAKLGTASVRLGGVPWKAATWTAGISQGALTIILVNNRYGISLSVGPFNGVGSYPLAFAPFHRIIMTPGAGSAAPCCWGGRSTVVEGQPVLNDEGTITITSVTATRIQGTFSAILAPGFTGNQTSNLTMTEGIFDLALP